MAKRRYDYIELNGRRFKLDMLETREEVHRSLPDIYSAYANPSSRKVSIWYDWAQWFYDNNGYCWVSSYNCNFFTIEGTVLDENGTKYYCRITHANKYCWKIA